MCGTNENIKDKILKILIDDETNNRKITLKRYDICLSLNNDLKIMKKKILNLINSNE